jgi:hypothetical protein
MAVVLVATLAACASNPPPAALPSTASTGPTASPSASPSANPSASPSPTPSRRPTPVRVAIFGDSQGTALYNTRPVSVSKSLRLYDESISACGIMRGQVTSRSGEWFDLISACPNWLSKWRSDAETVKPAIALVVIGAWEVFDLKTDHGTLVFGTPQWDQTFLTTLRSGLTALRASGAQVALSELPCYRPHSTNPRPPGWWPERGEDARTRHVNDLLRQVADGLHVFTVTPPDVFCTNPKIGDNPSYRYDGVHYLQPGASLYFRAVIPQLITLPA